MARFKIRNYNNAIGFNGSTSVLTKATPTGINTGTNSRSAMGWVYLTDDLVLSTFVQFKCNSAQSVGFTLGQLTGTYYYAFDTINAGNNLTMTKAQFYANFPINKWFHVAYVVTTTTISVYVNGVAVINGVSWGTAINTGTYDNLFIGKTQDGAQTNSYFFKGNMKDIIICNSALTSTEIQQNYYNEVIPSSAVNRFLMSEGTSTTVGDSIGSNSLTATSISWVTDVPLSQRVKTIAKPSEIRGVISWYEADQGVTIDGSTRVSQWDDLSGNGFHMTQSTSGLRPAYVASAINSLPGLQITAATDEYMTATTNFAGVARAHSMFCVIRGAAAGASIFNGFLCLGSAGSGGNSSTIGCDNTNKFWFGGAGYGTPTINTTIANATSYALGKTCDGRKDIGYFNGVRVTEAIQTANYNISIATTALIGRYISAGEGGNYYISLAAFFDRVLSDSEMQALTNYANVKYAAGTAVLRSPASGRTAASGRVTI